MRKDERNAMKDSDLRTLGMPGLSILIISNNGSIVPCIDIWLTLIFAVKNRNTI